MNEHCQKPCKHVSYCRLDADKTSRCLVEDDPRTKGLIFGRTWQSIQELQAREQTEKTGKK